MCIRDRIRRSVDSYFQPLMEQALENAKYEKWERESLQNKNVVSESLTTNAAS